MSSLNQGLPALDFLDSSLPSVSGMMILTDTLPSARKTMKHLQWPHNRGSVFDLRALADDRCLSLIGVISLA